MSGPFRRLLLLCTSAVVICLLLFLRSSDSTPVLEDRAEDDATTGRGESVGIAVRSTLTAPGGAVAATRPTHKRRVSRPPKRQQHSRQQSREDDELRALYHTLNPVTPILDDEVNFLHRAAWRGYKLRAPQDAPRVRQLIEEGVAQHMPGQNAAEFGAMIAQLADALFASFSRYDRTWGADGTGAGASDDERDATMPVFGTSCVGGDCGYVRDQIRNLQDVGIGHYLVVQNTDVPEHALTFAALQRYFPGRFTVFVRPSKLSCSESWNLLARVGFSHAMWTPMPANTTMNSLFPNSPTMPRDSTGEGLVPPIHVFLSNADWHPKDGHMPPFNRWVRRGQLQTAAARFFHFSSYALTWCGFTRVGFFDEVLFPALAEDVEWHLRAVSKGLGRLGLYPQWQEGSVHITRAAANDAVIRKRDSLHARAHYLVLKWNVVLGSVHDYEHAHPNRYPFNLEALDDPMRSWVVDEEHRRCQLTGEGQKMTNGRCYYDANVLRRAIPEGAGNVELPGGLFTRNALANEF